MQNVGRLEPGATYIYEQIDGKIYGRKLGGTERILVGEKFPPLGTIRERKLREEWLPILEAAEHNPALQDALDRVRIVYALTKEEQTIAHHPV
jgi:hypothetical protein